MKLQERSSAEDKLAQSTKDLVEAVDEIEEKRKKEEELKPTVEKIIQEILLGTRTPVQGMKLDIEIKGKFEIWGSESTKDSFFRYAYPFENGVEEEEPEEPTEDAEEGETEVDTPII